MKTIVVYPNGTEDEDPRAVDWQIYDIVGTLPNGKTVAVADVMWDMPDEEPIKRVFLQIVDGCWK